MTRSQPRQLAEYPQTGKRRCGTHRRIHGWCDDAHAQSLSILQFTSVRVLAATSSAAESESFGFSSGDCGPNARRLGQLDPRWARESRLCIQCRGFSATLPSRGQACSSFPSPCGGVWRRACRSWQRREAPARAAAPAAKRPNEPRPRHGRPRGGLRLRLWIRAPARAARSSPVAAAVLHVWVCGLQEHSEAGSAAGRGRVRRALAAGGQRRVRGQPVLQVRGRRGGWRGRARALIQGMRLTARRALVVLRPWWKHRMCRFRDFAPPEKRRLSSSRA